MNRTRHRWHRGCRKNFGGDAAADEVDLAFQEHEHPCLWISASLGQIRWGGCLASCQRAVDPEKAADYHAWFRSFR